jgi:hypothetical protein
MRAEFTIKGTNIRYRAMACLFVFLFIASFKLGAQTRYVLNNANTFNITDYPVLPDDHYSFERVLTDPKLAFKPDSLNPSVQSIYWAKITLYNPYPNNENYLFTFSATLNYTLYHYRADNKQWVNETAGLNVRNGRRQYCTVTCVLQKQAENTFYIKIDLRDLKAYNYKYKPAIVIKKEFSYTADEEILAVSFLICGVLLLSFSMYNLYLYFALKDDAYLYYVVVQIGALVYFTASKHYFNLVLPFNLYNVKVIDRFHIFYFDINTLLEHIGVAILFGGFIQFTRSYLGTKNILPVYDKALTLLCYSYVFLETVPPLITITGIHYIDIWLPANILLLIIIATCVATGIAAVKYKVNIAWYFLAAYILPLLFIASASVYMVIYYVASPFLPALAIISQILTFAVALVARVKHTNDDLKQREGEAVKMEAEITLAGYKHLLIEEENKNITLTMAFERERNDQLQQELEANQRELVGSNLYIHQKNRLLSDLKTQLQEIDTLHPDAQPEFFKNIQSALKDGAYVDEEWDKFKLHFEQVHPRFFKDMLAKHPTLTKYELRLCAYFHINLSTKEIAALLNIAPASVRQAKARLNKKMNF